MNLRISTAPHIHHPVTTQRLMLYVLLALLPAAYLLSLTGSVDAVWWSFPIAEIVSAIVTLICYSKIYRNKIKPML